MMPRIIMVTDGYCTDTDIIAGPDEPGNSMQQEQVNFTAIYFSEKHSFDILRGLEKI